MIILDFPKLSDIKAECAILSAACYKKEWLLDVLQSVSEKDFSSADTAAVFTVISQMYNAGEEVSTHTVAMKQKALADAGYVRGRDLGLVQIIDSAPIPTEFPGFLAAVKEMTSRRIVYRTVDKVLNMARQGESSGLMYDELEKMLVEKTKTDMKREILLPSDMQAAMCKAIEDRADTQKRNNHVLYTSFPSLNRKSGGLEKGDLVILSAESGAGKSAFAMNLAYGTACLNKRPTLYMNSEMNTEQMALRWASFISKVSHGALRNGTASAEEIEKAKSAVEVIKNSKLYTLNIPDMQIASVLGEVLRAKARYGIEVVIVDYIGRMDALNAKDVKEWQMMKSAAQRLKTMAQELQITVIMIAQLTSDGGRLAQSSYMSHEADLWLNIGKIAEEKLSEFWPWNYVLTFRKARNVENGQTVMLRFDGDTLTFTDQESKAKDMAGQKPLDAGAKTTKATGKDVPM
jgi:replicative DNA helicase